ELLYDVWQPNALVLPYLALLVVAAAVARGDPALVPWLVGLGSLVVQTHPQPGGGRRGRVHRGARRLRVAGPAGPPARSVASPAGRRRRRGRRGLVPAGDRGAPGPGRRQPLPPRAGGGERRGRPGRPASGRERGRRAAPRLAL